MTILTLGYLQDQRKVEPLIQVLKDLSIHNSDHIFVIPTHDTFTKKQDVAWSKKVFIDNPLMCEPLTCK